MRTVTYSQIKTLAADLAGRPRDKLPTSEALMLRAFFASELPDIWNREAWPELCDHLETVSLDANGCFDPREGDADEMGDILAIIVGNDPRLTNDVTIIPREQYTRLDDRVNVLADVSSGSLYVDWQTPAPQLLASAYDTEATLNALTIPERFYLPLAHKGAAYLLADEDPLKANLYKSVADAELLKQAARLRKPWWRQ